jgi:ubiquinone/menaquinone biosynthesis C-methylase UbiE
MGASLSQSYTPAVRSDEPYFSVLTNPKFLRARLTEEARREFFASGETLADAIWRTVHMRLDPEFAPTAILEYGCGVGRLAIPFAQRAARRAGTVTAVDRSVAMLDVAREEADRHGVTNIEFCTPDGLRTRARRFDFICCHLVFQRLPSAEGLALLRDLARLIGTGGVGVFQFAYRSRTPALVEAVRWLRGHVPGVNAMTNVVRGQPGSQPFIPTYVYNLDEVLAVLDECGFPASYLVFDDDADVSSATFFVQSPLSRRTAEPIDVNAVIASTSMESLNAAAEQYFASLTNWDHHLAKPFSTVDEAPWLLTHVALLLQALQLRPGMDVLEFGAGSGWLSRFVTQLGCRAILLDVSPTALRIAKELYERVPVIGDRPRPEYLMFDGTRIDLADASVDRIICFHAFHHAPNPAAIVAEFGRVLRPGGLAAFAEPGPRHSQAAQSQFEMRTYGVVENDVDVHELWRAARSCGFAEMKLMVFHGLPFHVSLERYEDFLRGGMTCAEWVADARVFLRNVRNFVLIKEGVERADSRSASGLACEIHAQLAEAPVEGSPLALTVSVTNVGQATWLPRSAGAGGVSLGVHLYDAAQRLVSSDVLSTPLTDPSRDIAPGEQVTVGVALPSRACGRYTIELDCVADGVSWFAQLGSRPARVDVDVKAAASTPA